VKKAAQPERITVHVSLSVSSRRGRKLVRIDGVPNEPTFVEASDSIVKALAKAYRWRDLIEDGEYSSVTELAKAKNVNQSYACRLFKLTLLAPGIIEEALNGLLPPQLGLNDLVKPLPLIWAEQQEHLKRRG
jgi:hypothetical protein